MSSILTNGGAMVALQTLKGINKNLGGVQDMISTGKKVATSKDNAAVWAISTVMKSDVGAFKAVSDSLALGQSTVAVARNASEQVTDLLQEMKSKIVAAQEDNVDRTKIQADVSELRDQITSVVGAAQFNGLNLLAGSDEVDILASLDRDNAGNVTSSEITIQRQNLEQKASVFGTGAAIAEGTATAIDNDSFDVANKLDVEKEARVTFAGAAGDFDDGDDITLTVGGQSFTVAAKTTPAAGNTTANYIEVDAATVANNGIATALYGLVNAAITSETGSLNGKGITIANGTAGRLDIKAQRNETTTISVAANGGLDAGATVAIAAATAGDDLVGADVTAATITATAATATLKKATNTVNFDAGAVAEGTSYKISMQKQGAATATDFVYVAREGDDLNDVAKGLKDRLDASGIEGLNVAVNKASDPVSTNVTMDIFYETGASTDLNFTVATAAGGTAGGGLELLADIDVSTSEGATSALVAIESLIQTSIDASAAFGSSEKRLEIQQSFVGKLTDSLTAGIGSLVDADMEEAAAKLQALQVQQQLGTQALSIANQAPQNILALFR